MLWRNGLCLAAAVAWLCAVGPVAAQGGDTQLRVGGVGFLSDLQRIILQQWVEEEGDDLPFEFREFVTGLQAMDALFSGEVEIASAAGVPIVDRFMFEHRENVPEDDRMVVLTSYSVLRNVMSLVARKTDSHEIPSDFPLHRIGVMQGTILEFILDRELMVMAMDRSGIKVVNVHLSDSASALETGLVDAVAVPEPYTQHLVDESAGTLYALQSFPVHQSSAMLVTTRRVLREKRDLIEQYLQGMIRAEQHLSENPDLVTEIVAKEFDMPESRAEAAMRQYSYRANLGQTSLSALQDIQAWRCRQKREGACYLPMRNAINAEILRAVDPRRVWILGD